MVIASTSYKHRMFRNRRLKFRNRTYLSTKGNGKLCFETVGQRPPVLVPQIRGRGPLLGWDFFFNKMSVFPFCYIAGLCANSSPKCLLPVWLSQGPTVVPQTQPWALSLGQASKQISAPSFLDATRGPRSPSPKLSYRSPALLHSPPLLLCHRFNSLFSLHPQVSSLKNVYLSRHTPSQEEWYVQYTVFLK